MRQLLTIFAKIVLCISSFNSCEEKECNIKIPAWLWEKYKANEEIENVKIDNQLDISWKPGFFLQTRDFLLGEQGDLLTVFDMEQKLATYRAILNGQL